VSAPDSKIATTTTLGLIGSAAEAADTAAIQQTTGKRIRFIPATRQAPGHVKIGSCRTEMPPVRSPFHP